MINGSVSDFIEVYDNVLSKRDCEILINQFEKSDDVSWARKIASRM